MIILLELSSLATARPYILQDSLKTPFSPSRGEWGDQQIVKEGERAKRGHASILDEDHRPIATEGASKEARPTGRAVELRFMGWLRWRLI
jgi:hypothetical protein